MARKILDVFLSSTARDLEPHRAAIHAELISTGLFHCIRQEDFGPQNAGAVELCCEKVKGSDIFIGLTGQRRGWEPDGDNAKRSITEMEHDWAKEAGRRRYLYVTPDDFPVPGNLRDTDEQHERQQAFRKRVMDGGERVVSQKGFETPERFAADLIKHLLTQLVTGDLITLLRPELSPQNPISPDEQRPAIAAAVERLAEDEDVDLLSLAKNPKNVDLADLEHKLTERAERHGSEGQSKLKISAEYWRHIGALAFLHDTQKGLAAYEKAVAFDPLQPEGWRYLGELQFRVGDYGNAEKSFDRLLAVGQSTDDVKAKTMGSMGLGWISASRGDLTKAETLISDAVRLARAANWQEGTTRAYVNLGIIHETRGDLDTAEKMYLESLKLDEEQGNKQGMARAYGNLGTIQYRRGNLNQSEEMHLKSLELEEVLGRKEGMASSYNNLGNIYYDRDNFDEAEVMYLKSLALSQEAGSRWEMAAACYNLGIIHEGRGDKAAMCDFWRKGRDLYREMELPIEATEVEDLLKRNKCGDG
jgi:tetratricopeptide (TPR) repeat protein